MINGRTTTWTDSAAVSVSPCASVTLTSNVVGRLARLRGEDAEHARAS